MSSSLSPEAIETLRRLDQVGVGQAALACAPRIAAELLATGLAAEASGGELEITHRGEQYLSSGFE
ncbi:hypothetical protein [Paraburkholderia sp.]|uniref:hypothetical protein n=1 Tax=Paraburkholderia sp. TaxID=1926495 RepID=UPI0023976DBE|nr:hypothetical protein [Paraburkholderia sp.]MDE1184452.1 hypothetical protein [Paraburkholderia sp.]